MPDLDGVVEQVLAEGDRVAGRVTWRGTKEGAFVGVAPTGRSVASETYYIVRFNGGKAVEWWGFPTLPPCQHRACPVC